MRRLLMEENSTEYIKKLDKLIEIEEKMLEEIRTLRFSIENLKAKFDKMF
jgi:ABC-type Zn uptake system ZnuABC Zn-binding protein ZnuA